MYNNALDVIHEGSKRKKYLSILGAALGTMKERTGTKIPV